jgi:hypothetical protein|tara:strand:+ start:27 stop:167 length:141 start_codon:yes stop_codon:yes gene_type:complete
MPFYQPKKLPNLMVAPNGARKVKKDLSEITFTIQENVNVIRICLKG